LFLPLILTLIVILILNFQLYDFTLGILKRTSRLPLLLTPLGHARFSNFKE
jgi:hypothetical protein